MVPCPSQQASPAARPACVFSKSSLLSQDLPDPGGSPQCLCPPANCRAMSDSSNFAKVTLVSPHDLWPWTFQLSPWFSGIPPTTTTHNLQKWGSQAWMMSRPPAPSSLADAAGSACCVAEASTLAGAPRVCVTPLCFSDFPSRCRGLSPKSSFLVFIVFFSFPSVSHTWTHVGLYCASVGSFSVRLTTPHASNAHPAHCWLCSFPSRPCMHTLHSSGSPAVHQSVMHL